MRNASIKKDYKPSVVVADLFGSVKGEHYTLVQIDDCTADALFKSLMARSRAIVHKDDV